MDKPTCTVDGCTRPVKAAGMCSMHLTRKYRNGDPGESESRRSPTGGKCSHDGCDTPARYDDQCRHHYRIARLASNPLCPVDGCTRPIENAGLCGMHYYRVQTHGEAGIGAALVRQHRADERCEVDGCERRPRTKGKCKAHYNQELLSGVPASVFGLCLTCAALVDLRTPSGRLRKPNVLCEACRLKISNGRWAMTTTELAERDGLLCSICGDLMDMSLKLPNLFSASVDHVLPRARGGKDKPDNLALAHLICNMRKGFRSD